jgi:hypothetical protein
MVIYILTIGSVTSSPIFLLLKLTTEVIKSLSGTEIDGGIEQDNSLKSDCLSSQMIISGMSR